MSLLLVCLFICVVVSPHHTLPRLHGHVSNVANESISNKDLEPLIQWYTDKIKILRDKTNKENQTREHKNLRGSD